MSNRSHRNRRRIVAGGLTLLLVLGPPAQAFAESAAERRLRVLEETRRKTQDEVQELRRQLDQQKAATQETQKKVDEAATSARTASADAKDRKSTRLNSSHSQISYAVFCLKKKKKEKQNTKSRESVL